MKNKNKYPIRCWFISPVDNPLGDLDLNPERRPKPRPKATKTTQTQTRKTTNLFFLQVPIPIKIFSVREPCSAIPEPGGRGCVIGTVGYGIGKREKGKDEMGLFVWGAFVQTLLLISFIPFGKKNLINQTFFNGASSMNEHNNTM